jgi:hypothetical protein
MTPRIPVSKSVAVVEQPPKGGDGVMIYRDSSCACIHLAVLCICDVHALYALDQSAMMVWGYVPIYGSSRVLCVRHALCGCVTLYCTRSVVTYVRVWP